jgi:hypothetical protein
VKVRVLPLALACAAGLYGQYGHHRFSWQEACFKNPGAPYCAGNDFAVKPTRPGKNGAPQSSGADADPGPYAPEVVAPSVIVVGSIDWRFADPLADSLTALNFSKVSASPLARSVMAELGATQGLTEPDLGKVFEALSSVGQVAMSVRGDETVLMITGRATDSTLPVLDPGWKAMPVLGNAMLIGRAEAVDQALQRIATDAPLTEWARQAKQRQASSDFWAVGSAKLAGQEAAKAGVKTFSVTASMRDGLTSDAAFEFEGVPDPSALRTWPAALGEATIDGNAVAMRVSMEADEVQRMFPQLAASLLGQRLGALIQAARYLPARDSNGAARTKPVIYGLDDGPKEVKQ